VFCNNKVFDRNGDADQDITKSVDLVANLYSRKSAAYFERKIFSYATTEHLRMDLLPRIQQMAISRRPDHPWKDMNDMQMPRKWFRWSTIKRQGAGFSKNETRLHSKPQI